MRTMIMSVVIPVLWAGFTGAFAQLPPEILLDQYLLQADQRMAQKDHEGALEALQQILALQKEHELTLPEEFHFKYAQVAFSAGSIRPALELVNQYLETAGRDGKFYREALELSIKVGQIQTQLAQYPAQVEQLMAAKDYAGALEVMDEVVTLQKEHNLTLPEDFHSKRVKIRVAKEPCTGQPKGTSCWMELANVPGCYVWNPDFQVDETVTWTGGVCRELRPGDGHAQMDLARKRWGRARRALRQRYAARPLGPARGVWGRLGRPVCGRQASREVGLAFRERAGRGRPVCGGENRMETGPFAPWTGMLGGFFVPMGRNFMALAKDPSWTVSDTAPG